MTSSLEARLAWQITGAGLRAPDVEHRGIPGRKFRFDFAWPDRMLAVEVEGGTWIGGRHTSGAGFRADCQKYNLAAMAGWRVLRFTADMIDSGEALKMITEAIK